MPRSPLCYSSDQHKESKLLVPAELASEKPQKQSQTANTSTTCGFCMHDLYYQNDLVEQGISRPAARLMLILALCSFCAAPTELQENGTGIRDRVSLMVQLRRNSNPCFHTRKDPKEIGEPPFCVCLNWLDFHSQKDTDCALH